MLVVKQFTANWCHGCRMIKPIMNEIAAETTGVDFQTIDIDSNQSEAGKYSIISIPVVLFIRDGVVVNRMLGIRTKESYIQAINAYK